MCRMCSDPPDRLAILFALPETPELKQLCEQLQATGYDAYIAPTFEEALTATFEHLDRMDVMVVGDHMDDILPTSFAHSLLHQASDKLDHNVAFIVVSQSPEICREMVMCCSSSGIDPASLRSELERHLRIELPAPPASR